MRYPRRVASIMLFGPVSMNAAERLAFRKPYGTPVAPQPDGSHLLKFWNYAYTRNPGTDIELVPERLLSCPLSRRAE